MKIHESYKVHPPLIIQPALPIDLRSWNGSLAKKIQMLHDATKWDDYVNHLTKLNPDISLNMLLNISWLSIRIFLASRPFQSGGGVGESPTVVLLTGFATSAI